MVAELVAIITGMCSIGRCSGPVPIGFVPICDDFLMVSLIQRSTGSTVCRRWSADAKWCVSMHCAAFSFAGVGQCSFGSGLIVRQGQSEVNAILKASNQKAEKCIFNWVFLF